MTTETENLCVRVAEAMGWTRIKHGTASHVGGFKSWLSSKWGLCGTPPEDKDKPEDDQAYEFVPAFTSDLNAAMTLCERLKGEGFEACFVSAMGMWNVQFEKNDNEGFEATAPTLALAIAKAFLSVSDSQKSPLDESAKTA